MDEDKHIPAAALGSITTGDALKKYWHQLSSGWSGQTTEIYYEIYQHLIDPISYIPVNRVDLQKHITPIIANNDRYRHLLQRFFGIVSAGEGCNNPFASDSE